MTGRGLRPVNLEMRAVQVRRGDGPRIKAAHLIDDVPDRLRPVDGRKLLREHRSQRCFGRILRRAGCRTRLDGMQCIGQQRRTDGGQPRQQGRGILQRLDGRFADFDNVALVHSGREVHRRHAGLVQTVQNGPLRRGGAAQRRQDARVDVDAAELRDIQHALRQDFPVGHDGNDVRAQGAKLLHGGIIAERRGLIDRQAGGQRDLLDLGHGELHAAVLRHIRLRVDADEVKAVRDQAGQAVRRDLRRAHEDDSHASSSSSAISSSVSM